jgi:hypothetical protein
MNGTHSPVALEARLDEPQFRLDQGGSEPARADRGVS